jgi:putative membrane protein
MINYNPKDWFTFIFRFHKSDTLRQLLPLIAGICIYTGVIAYLAHAYWHIPENSPVRNISILHGLLGFVISLLLVFRTNTAYDRWWEGRKLWGSLVNSSRNLAIKLAAIFPSHEKDQRNFFRKIIPAYAYALKNHLCHESTGTALFETGEPLQQHIHPGKHIPNQVAALMIQRVTHLYNEGKIKGDQLIILNAELQSFTDICGGCERIRNTPIPYSYSVFLKKFIFFYIMTMPFGYVFSLGYYVIPVVAFIFYVLASLELIAEEIEDPFGNDQNDLPIDKIALGIHKQVDEILLP